MLSHSLDTLFAPQTIAVVGASDRYGSAGRSVFSQLMVYCPHIQCVPINPKHKTVGSLKAYESLTDAAQDFHFDLVLAIVSADKVAAIVREAVKQQIGQVVVVNDLDPAPHQVGKYLKKAAEIARKYQVKLLAIPEHGVEGLLGRSVHTAAAYIGHGESIADCLHSYAVAHDMDFSRFLPLNPQADYPISTGQVIDYISQQDTTTALLVHIGVLDNPRELLSALRAASVRKPVVVLNTLPDEHEADIWQQVLTEQHILVAKTLTEFFTAAKLIHTGLRIGGKRVALIGNTPQIGALTIKSMAQYGLELAPLSSSTQKNLARLLPYKSAQCNPFYLPSDAAPVLFQAALAYCVNDEHSDAVLLIVAGRNNADHRHTAHIAAQWQAKTRKPLLLVWLGGADTPEIRHDFNQNKNLHFKQPEHALQGLASLNLYREQQQQRHQLATFFDYRQAAQAANETRQYLRPVLPLIAMPASKTAVNQLLNVLNLTRHPRKKLVPQLFFHWQNQAPFGQMLILANQQGEQKLLPPITPERAQAALHALQLDRLCWQEWLLEAGEILFRLPEIKQLQLEINLENQTFSTHLIKLLLEEPAAEVRNILTPYPQQEETVILPNGQTAYLRSVRAEDAALLQQHIESLDENSRYLRFMSHFDTPPASLLARLSHIDYQRDNALILLDNTHQVLGVAHVHRDQSLTGGEFGISVAPNAQGQGIGYLLMQKLIAHAREQGYTRIYAEILAENRAMQKLAAKLGFILQAHRQDKHIVLATLLL